MAGWQQIQIIGNCTADPELRYLPSGVAVTSVGVAVNRKWTDRTTNERKEEVVYFKVSFWRQLAEVANQYLKKGSPVFVAGRVSADAYLANDGTPRSSLEITASDLQLLGSRSDSNAEDSDKPF